MNAEELVRGYAERFWNQGDDGFADEGFAADAAYHDPMVPGLPPGPAGARQRKATYETALSEHHVVVHDIVVDGDRGAARWTYTGRSSGEFMGSPPTGDTVTVTGMHFFRVRDGQIAEAWIEYDSAGFLRGLGILPPM